MSFENAPVSKGLMLWLAVATVLSGIFDIKYYFHLQLVPHISTHHQYWRLFTHHLVCQSFSDLFVSELLIYNVGVQIERFFGSVKFASFITVSTLVATIAEFGSLLLLNHFGLNIIPASPIALVFSILYQFSRIVPSIYHFRIFGIVFNNKIFTYLLATQLAFSSSPGSFVSALVGIVTGQLYRTDLFNLKAYELPPWLIRLSSSVAPYVIGSTRPPRRTNRALHEGSRTSLASVPRASAGAATDEDEGPVTTARRNTAGRRGDNPRSGTTTSVMRDWVNELTGRDGSSSGLRIPSEAEISQVSAMFPNVSRETVVGALQRRYVLGFLPSYVSPLENLMWAIRCTFRFPPSLLFRDFVMF
ncbi:hypothetical protein BDM02DRAFT_3203887 [Thelephora ganbajun]|uniref:Uncharacterized protein n=1 Tax=Thelephora ganbajun TaxID=370292 RepID=A0ACB6ZQ93_THEGA|nr:hypothetical protein BDM02DRAFT_3203887 [Thelephora ganbajun]